MVTRKLIGTAAFGAVLAAGGVAGAVLGSPSLSDAQTAVSASVDGADSGQVGAHRGPGGRGLALDAAAEALGLSEADLRARLDQGETIAEIAEAEQVELDSVIDAIVAAGTERIDEWAAEAKAALPDRVSEAVERDWTDGPWHGPGRR